MECINIAGYHAVCTLHVCIYHRHLIWFDIEYESRYKLEYLPYLLLYILYSHSPPLTLHDHNSSMYDIIIIIILESAAESWVDTH